MRTPSLIATTASLVAAATLSGTRTTASNVLPEGSAVSSWNDASTPETSTLETLDVEISDGGVNQNRSTSGPEDFGFREKQAHEKGLDSQMILQIMGLGMMVSGGVSVAAAATVKALNGQDAQDAGDLEQGKQDKQD
ncbi:hypothetical protein NliqN6_2263 [Naganishia liquefaciens]|uniref:Uncharacterized protein n=1 Tax=Naganishia liquefaciens TaxID=104408 RepID=A0A8H3TR23_9TREE|nr:hypothetical protein NliqN6_2263 [Naganishia liquefaciens]